MNRREVLEQLKERRSFIETEKLNRMTIFNYLCGARPVECGKYINPNYHLLNGLFKRNIKFTINGKDYFLLISGKTQFVQPNQIVIGREKGGKIYLISESFPAYNRQLSVITVPQSTLFEGRTTEELPSLESRLISYNTPERVITQENMTCINNGMEASLKIGQLLESEFGHIQGR